MGRLFVVVTACAAVASAGGAASLSAARGDCSVAVREEWERLVREYCVAAGGGVLGLAL